MIFCNAVLYGGLENEKVNEKVPPQVDVLRGGKIISFVRFWGDMFIVDVSGILAMLSPVSCGATYASKFSHLIES